MRIIRRIRLFLISLRLAFICFRLDRMEARHFILERRFEDLNRKYFVIEKKLR